jgi:hypothetical protein
MNGLLGKRFVGASVCRLSAGLGQLLRPEAGREPKNRCTEARQFSVINLAASRAK